MNPDRPSRLVRFYLWQGRQWDRTINALQGLHSGLWLGILTREQLEAADDLHYRTHPAYSGEAHNLRGLFPWEEEAMRHFSGRRRLLIAGAGAGRELLALERLGHEVDGFDCNSALVDFASEFLPRQGAEGRVRLLPRDQIPAEGAYDGAIVGWSAYTHVVGRDRRIGLLRGIRTRVGEGAPLLLSFLTRGEGGGRSKLVHSIARPIRRLLHREPPEPGDDLAPAFVHMFVEAEVEAEMRAAGFTLRRYVEQGGGPRESGWAVGIAAGPESRPDEKVV